MNSEVNMNSPTSPNQYNSKFVTDGRTTSPVQNGIHQETKEESDNSSSEMNNKQSVQIENCTKNEESRTKSDPETKNSDTKLYSTHRLSSDRCINITTGSSSLQSFNVVMEKISPKNGNKVCISLFYIKLK